MLERRYDYNQWLFVEWIFSFVRQCWRHSDSEPSIIEVMIDSIWIRNFLLLIHKRSNNQDPTISHTESSHVAKRGHRWWLSQLGRPGVATDACGEADVNRSGTDVPFLHISALPPAISAWAWSCTSRSHLKRWFASSWPDFLLFTKETPMVTGITQQPQHSWELLVNQSHTGLADGGERGTKQSLLVLVTI